MSIEKRLEERNKLLEYVDNCELKTPEEVARLFEEYTKLIWDHKLVGKIYDFYCDDAVIHSGNGNDVTGVDNVFAGTLQFISSFPDLKFKFLDIFAEGDEESGYKFVQAVYYDGINTGYSQFGKPTGKPLSEDDYCMSVCECLVKKVNGRWKIVEEWLVRSSESLENTMKSFIQSEENDFEETAACEEIECE
ncbi:nuclear transport factor 2 family protein [Maledivibacter halophilus]|uniref:SnoaL-like domain-containing protein n=1 Tax=Maledivibacter halophilus TaxID=36842 RepID=A0A1T5IAU3_9FIRM|nr:hypothetical protein [Maledivibacter halophilus]SKC36200.1 hypothetical protein SAMN02194393_00130 [Maledivibacter halophilus]